MVVYFLFDLCQSQRIFIVGRLRFSLRYLQLSWRVDKSEMCRIFASTDIMP